MGVRTYNVLAFPDNDELMILRERPRHKRLLITMTMVLQGGEEEPIEIEVRIITLAIFDVFSAVRGRQQSVSVYGTTRHAQFGDPQKDFVIDVTYNLATFSGVAETRAK